MFVGIALLGPFTASIATLFVSGKDDGESEIQESNY
jgi:hypothetical protein